MPVITCLPGSNWPNFNNYLDNTISDYEFQAIPKAQVHVEVKNMVDKSVQTEPEVEVLTYWVANQEPEQQDESGSRQKSSSNQPSKNQPSKQTKSSKNDKEYESGSDDEQINDGDDDDDEEDDRKKRGYEASDETSNDDEDEEDTEEEEDEATPPPVSRKRKNEEPRREKNLKRRRPRQEEETEDESGPMKKRSRPEKKIIHEYYREIGRSGKDEFRMEDLFDDNEIKVIHDFLSEIGKMRTRRRQQPTPKREIKEGNGRRTSGKTSSKLERKHSDIYESYSKKDQDLIHDYYQQIGHKGGKYRGSDVDEEELEQEDRKVHPGFLKEKRQRQQNVVHDFLSKVAKQKRWGQATQPADKKRQEKKKMRSVTSREI